MGPNNAPLQDDHRHLEYRSTRDQDDNTTATKSSVDRTNPGLHPSVEAPRRAPENTVEPTATAPYTTVEPAPTAPPPCVEPSPIAVSNPQEMEPTTPKIDAKMHGHPPALLSDGTNYGIWKQALRDKAIINNVEAVLDETSP